MFALALWDTERKGAPVSTEINYGIKPLYYAQIGSRFLFGSEIKAIVLIQHLGQR